jgi:hypothetical protein
MFEGSVGIGGTTGVIDQNIAEHMCPHSRIMPVHQDSTVTIRNCRWQATYSGSDNGQSTRLCFNGDQAERLVVRWHDADIGGPIPMNKILAICWRDEDYEIADTEFIGKILQCCWTSQP